jgi:very-short-patch-repair endonuclease
LRRAAERLGGPGCGNARRVAESVDPRAGSGLESALRAILIDGGVAGFEPQVLISGGDFRAQVDLAHRAAGRALDADGFEFHGTREGLVADCCRYDESVALGWRVLRLSFEQILGHPAWVARRIVDRSDERASCCA